MKVKSLGYQTDLIFPGFDGEIIDRGDYLVILTPNNPTFYWGNFILFKKPPERDDVSLWKSIFQREITSRLDTHHFTFGWDTIHGEIGEVESFLEEGFDLAKLVVLSTNEVYIPSKYNTDVVIRPISEDWEWQQATLNQIACRESGHDIESYTKFKTEQMLRYQNMVKSGIGQWFGAFMGKELVADLGIFSINDRARFQNVGTHPDYRRLGICGALVYESSRYAFENMKVKTLVMVADEEYHAARIYESIGFIPKERQVGLCWWKKN